MTRGATTKRISRGLTVAEIYVHSKIIIAFFILQFLLKLTVREKRSCAQTCLWRRNEPAMPKNKWFLYADRSGDGNNVTIFMIAHALRGRREREGNEIVVSNCDTINISAPVCFDSFFFFRTIRLMRCAYARWSSLLDTGLNVIISIEMDCF